MMTFAAAALAAQSPSGGARQQAVVVMPDNPGQRRMQEEIGWADAVVSNGVVHVSGVPAFLAPGETDTEKAYVRAFEKLGKTLQRAGVSWDDVVSITTYHTDVNAQIETFAKVKARYIKGPPPAWSAIGTNGLLQPGGLVEIALIAHVPPTAARK
ncbi:MAG TPA: Rid family hydrolase [Sphingomicrobium sp.]|nr:Rid family hydrolase [Sphingomicrobium sp.]